MRRGFTLIELLAVIVILAVIALIATPTITSLIEKTRKGGAESSALGWIDAIEKQSMVNELSDANKIDLNGRYSVSELISKGVKVKGDAPSSGYVALSNGKVSSSTLCIGNYKVVIENNKVKSSTKENNCVVDNSYPRYVYSRANGGTRIGYPIDAGIDVGEKYVLTVPEINFKQEEGSLYIPSVDIAFDEEEECQKVSSDLCVKKNYKTPNLDYKTKPDENWRFYLKHTLNSNGIIEEIDVCGKYNGHELCLKRIVDESNYNYDKNLLLDTFGNDKCDFSRKIECGDESAILWAFIENDGNLTITADDFGNCSVSLKGEAACMVTRITVGDKIYN